MCCDDMTEITKMNGGEVWTSPTSIVTFVTGDVS